MNRFLLRWGASLLLAGLTGAAAAQSVLRISAAPDGRTPEQQAEQFEPLGEYLSKRLKTRAQWVPFKTEAQLSAALLARKVDLAWIPAGTLVMLQAQAPGQVLPLVQRDEDARSRSVIVAMIPDFRPNSTSSGASTAASAKIRHKETRHSCRKSRKARRHACRHCRPAGAAAAILLIRPAG